MFERHNDVESVETSRVFLQVFKEVTRNDLVEEHGAMLEFVDVHLLHCDTDEILAATLSCLPNFIVYGASFMDGFGLLHFHHCRVFGNLVIPEAKVLRDGKYGTVVVSHVG
jgi:hypothetical protein